MDPVVFDFATAPLLRRAQLAAPLGPTEARRRSQRALSFVGGWGPTACIVGEGGAYAAPCHVPEVMGDFGEIVRMGCGSARRISLRSWIVLELLAEEREVTAAHARAPPPRQPRAERAVSVTRASRLQRSSI